MADLPLPLLRAPLVDRDSLLVARAWQPWFEAWFRTLSAGPDDIGFGLGPEGALQTPLVDELRRQLEVETATGDLLMLVQLIQDALDVAVQAAAQSESPTAIDAQQLDHKPGDFYQRFALATS